MMTDTVRMMAWVGCMACYNNGRLVGDWVAAEDAATFVPCDIPGHEEWWVYDHEGLPITGDCSPAFVTALAEIIGDQVEWMQAALRAWIEDGRHVTDIDGLPDLGSFEDQYCGEYDSERDYAESMAEDAGLIPDDDNPLARYIDWDHWTHDLFCYEYRSVPAPVSGVFVFRNL